jgi:hypothetical protein
MRSIRSQAATAQAEPCPAMKKTEERRADELRSARSWKSNLFRR